MTVPPAPPARGRAGRAATHNSTLTTPSSRGGRDLGVGHMVVQDRIAQPGDETPTDLDAGETTLLVVDDHRSFADLLSSALECVDGIRCVGTATTAEAGLSMVFALRPSVGLQRVLFRKAADAGVQVNGLVSAGPTIGLLMPYYISFDRTATQTRVINVATDEIVNEQYDPFKHADSGAILDRGPLFSGIGQTKIVPGFHVRGGLSFEYGRYRDAVTGLEVGFLVEAYTKRLLILSPGTLSDVDDLNRQFFPSVYLTLYFGHRS